ncbi:hypothetical protein [Escherichia coli]|uniref:Uncharacterized protein n=1 Tax=Escherichia coli TaxID=562 RepID=A0A376LPQ1_ECOLX|nr:hypothetical protein [Escherichia coli]DAH84661.1 MAG TPA: PolyVal Metallopeptidase superfamily domain [Caudoviricetes sp.]EFG1287528.1 hypothetical protein [Escherichia coli]EIH7479336.1 hypothetical protein [Escherichia coli]EIH8038108.1 hypothetical protein [Escherichia coli]EJU0138847.1 hypothetical protein [Escherichia coli]
MAKAKGIKLPQFKVPLFEHTTVFFCPTREMFYEFCEKAGIPIEPDFELAGGLTLTCTGETGGNFYVIAVFNNETGTLVHECAHTTFHVLSDVGVVATTDPTHPANETYAYMVGRIFDAFFPILAESNEAQVAAMQAAEVVDQALEQAEQPKEEEKPAKKGKRKPKQKDALVPRVMSFKRG